MDSGLLKTKSKAVDYDTHDVDYYKHRKPSPAVVKKLEETFAQTEGLILSLGCGTGHYEDELRDTVSVIGLDKSIGMLRMQKEYQKFNVNGDMINLPFSDNAFKGVYFMQSFHHVGGDFNLNTEERTCLRRQVLKEAFRVLSEGYIVIFQRHAAQIKAIWFWKYFPGALERKLYIQPSISMLFYWLYENGFQNVKASPVDDPMIDGFYNPEAPLNESFRHSFSEFSYISEEDIAEGSKKLKNAIKSGSVYREIEACRDKFNKIGGSVFMISGIKI